MARWSSDWDYGNRRRLVKSFLTASIGDIVSPVARAVWHGKTRKKCNGLDCSAIRPATDDPNSARRSTAGRLMSVWSGAVVKTTENTVSTSPMVLQIWKLLLSQKPPLEKAELCKINRLSALNANLAFSACRPTGRTVRITKTCQRKRTITCGVSMFPSQVTYAAH